VAALALGCLGPRRAPAQDWVLPVIQHLAAPARLAPGATGELTVAFVAPRGDVVAMVVTVEGLEGPLWQRDTSQREVSLVTTAYGRESGRVTWPLRFPSAGRRRIQVALITEAREASDPAAVEIDVGP
jgi:hypothetical protein